MAPTEPKSIGNAIDRRVIQQMAGWRSFARGEEYFAAGQVGLVDEHDNTITANVHGSRSYLVKLWVEGGQLEYSCTCPVGADGAFCKHCVTLGLAWLEPKQARTTGRKRAKPDVTLDDVRSYLGGLDKNALVEMIIERARSDEQFGQLLVSRTAMKKSKSSGPAAYKQAIDAAVNHGGYVDYRSAHDYARGIGDVIRSLQELLEEGYAAHVIELAEYALQAVEEAMDSVDDSPMATWAEFYKTFKSSIWRRARKLSQTQRR